MTPFIVNVGNVSDTTILMVIKLTLIQNVIILSWQLPFRMLIVNVECLVK